jgi:hypothetical protein
MPSERLSYPTAFFDVAAGFAIIHHSVAKALAELHSVLTRRRRLVRRASGDEPADPGLSETDTGVPDAR